MMACRLPQASALAVNPQLDLRGYTDGHASGPRVMEVFNPQMSVEQMCDLYPQRTSVTHVLRQLHRGGRFPRLWIMQNIHDRYHYVTHLLPFCEAFGLEPQGSLACGNVQITLFEDEAGHPAPPPANTLLTALADLGIQAAAASPKV
jgi:hypothetical protein